MPCHNISYVLSFLSHSSPQSTTIPLGALGSRTGKTRTLHAVSLAVACCSVHVGRVSRFLGNMEPVYCTFLLFCTREREALDCGLCASTRVGSLAAMLLACNQLTKVSMLPAPPMTGSCIQHEHSCLAPFRLTGRLPFVVLLRLHTDFSQNEIAGAATRARHAASARDGARNRARPAVGALAEDAMTSASDR